MTVILTADIFCDSPGCHEWIDGDTAVKPDIKQARADAAARGWSRRRDPTGTTNEVWDLCPEHTIR